MANTAKARGLGAELRELRQEASLTVRALEQRLDFSRSTLSRIERGDKVPSAEDLGALLAVYGVTGDRRTELIRKAQDAGQPNWTEIGHPGIPRQLSALIEFEREAARISALALNRIPGLLQTKDYTRTILRSGGIPEEQIETLVSIRSGRQEILTRNNPVDFLAIIDEVALCRTVGTKSVMVEQLNHILHLGAAGNVTVQILPLSMGAHTGQDGPHVLFEFTKAEPIVHLEHRRSGQFLDEPEDTSDFRDLTATLQKQALTVDESAELLTSYLGELEES